MALTIVNSFLESYDFSGKRIILFATSGGSGQQHIENYINKSLENLGIAACQGKLLRKVTGICGVCICSGAL